MVNGFESRPTHPQCLGPLHGLSRSVFRGSSYGSETHLGTSQKWSNCAPKFREVLPSSGLVAFLADANRASLIPDTIRPVGHSVTLLPARKKSPTAVCIDL
jgi:hypothetical protein